MPAEYVLRIAVLMFAMVAFTNMFELIEDFVPEMTAAAPLS